MQLKKPRRWVRHDGMRVMDVAKGRIEVVDWYLRLPFAHATLPSGHWWVWPLHKTPLGPWLPVVRKMVE